MCSYFAGHVEFVVMFMMSHAFDCEAWTALEQLSNLNVGLVFIYNNVNGTNVPSSVPICLDISFMCIMWDLLWVQIRDLQRNVYMFAYWLSASWTGLLHNARYNDSNWLLGQWPDNDLGVRLCFPYALKNNQLVLGSPIYM